MRPQKWETVFYQMRGIIMLFHYKYYWGYLQGSTICNLNLKPVNISSNASSGTLFQIAFVRLKIVSDCGKTKFDEMTED